MTAFTIYLKDTAKCEVVGVDPDVFDTGMRYKGHGVSRDLVRRTGLRVVQSGMEVTPLRSDIFDRVFCLSVIEHLLPETARRGIPEMARILKPGGRLVITVDVNMHSEISSPLTLFGNPVFSPWER
jgi:SAM-dependent methyltransferase